MDGGAWWAAVHGVAKSQTRLATLFCRCCNPSLLLLIVALVSVLDILSFYVQPPSAGYQGWLHLSNINSVAMIILVSGI